MEPGVHNLEAAVPQGACDHLGPPVVAVEPGFGYDHPVGTLHEVSMIGTTPVVRQTGFRPGAAE